MFENSGRKIRVYAIVMFILGVIASLIFGIIFGKTSSLLSGYSSYYSSSFNFLGFFGIFIGGTLVSFISSLFISAFGEAVEHLRQININTTALQALERKTDRIEYELGSQANRRVNPVNPGVPNRGMLNAGNPNHGVPNHGSPIPGAPVPGVPNPGMHNPAVPNAGAPNPADPNAGAPMRKSRSSAPSHNSFASSVGLVRCPNCEYRQPSDNAVCARCGTALK